MMETKLKASFLTGLIFVIAGLLAKTFYREYIYNLGIDDFGLADSLPSFLYVVGFSQILMIRPVKYPPLAILVVTLGSIIYELRQSSHSGILDTSDIIASVAGGLISWLILYLVEKKFGPKEL